MQCYKWVNPTEGLSMKSHTFVRNGSIHAALVLVVLSILSLSQPAAAIDLLVYNTNDSGNGSLRQAIQNNDAFGGGNTIIFSNTVTGTIVLTSGELFISANVTILGPGSQVLGVSGNGSNRVFQIFNGNVNISSLTIRDGKIVGATGSGSPGGSAYGGGIYCESFATLTLTGCIISNCWAVGGEGARLPWAQPGGEAYGGGIFNRGNLTMDRCWLTSNRANGGTGGPLGFEGTTGGPGGTGYGGGILNQLGELVMRECTVSGNHANFGPGGFGNVSSGPNGNAYAGGLANHGGRATLINTTVANNTANGGGYGAGGGIDSGSTNTALVSCTIAGNSATSSGGGLYAINWTPLCFVANTIIAGNSAASFPDVSGLVNSGGYNLIGNSSGSTSFTNTGDQLNLDPLLGPLADYGGPTLTMALRADSPAMDKGNSFGSLLDQRVFPRPLDDHGISNAAGGDGADIGAYEIDHRFRIADFRPTGSNVALSLMTVLGKKLSRGIHEQSGIRQLDNLHKQCAWQRRVALGDKHWRRKSDAPVLSRGDPTLNSHAHRVASEEIFGPVLSVMIPPRESRRRRHLSARITPRIGWRWWGEAPDEPSFPQTLPPLPGSSVASPHRQRDGSRGRSPHQTHQTACGYLPVQIRSKTLPLNGQSSIRLQRPFLTGFS